MNGDRRRFNLERFRALNDDDCWAPSDDTEPWSGDRYRELSPAALAAQEPFEWTEPRPRRAHRAPGRLERLRAWFAGLMRPVFEDEEQ